MGSFLRHAGLLVALLFLAACSSGPTELSIGECVDIVGIGGESATERLVTVDCDTDDTNGIYRVVWIEEATDADPVTITRLATTCSGPTMLPDADMLQDGDRTVVCFEPLR